MADTYSQIFYHVVFGVRFRESLIFPGIKARVYKYITGIIQKQGQKLFIINGMPDHIHLLLNCTPNVNLSNLVKEIKEHSSKFINDQNMLAGKFYWQKGFGAFSVSKKDIGAVLNYIKEQESHHKTINFRDEYRQFLLANEIEFNEKYFLGSYLNN
jgi:putative transposase